jgi:RHS repeat-associated protein
MTDAADGSLAAVYEYTPFGELVATEGPAANANAFRFSTKYYDAETGLNYYGYRYYAPKVQRWTSRDPLGEAGGVNLYAFVGNDPVNYVDPIGTLRRSGKHLQNDTGAEQITLYGDGDAPFEPRLNFDLFSAPKEGDLLRPFQDDDGQWVIGARVGKVVDQRKYFRPGHFFGTVWQTQITSNGIAEAGEIAQFLQSGGVPIAVQGTLEVPWTQEDGYFRAAYDQALSDLYRLAGVQELADSIADGMDTLLRFVPGSALLLDVPEVITGESSTIAGQRKTGGERVFAGAAVVGGAVLAWMKFARQADEVARLSNAAGEAPARHILRLSRTNRVVFDGLEVRAVRDVSHVKESTLRQMAKDGFAARDIHGTPLVLHHLGQNPAGPIVEIPAPLHNIHNRIQHPLGNAPGVGLTPAQRAAFDTWRVEYWKARAVEELTRRGL